MEAEECGLDRENVSGALELLLAHSSVRRFFFFLSFSYILMTGISYSSVTKLIFLTFSIIF